MHMRTYSYLRFSNANLYPSRQRYTRLDFDNKIALINRAIEGDIEAYDDL
jgi:hypothetical protein